VIIEKLSSSKSGRHWTIKVVKGTLIMNITNSRIYRCFKAGANEGCIHNYNQICNYTKEKEKDEN